MDLLPYFAYGTTQKGFAHHRRLADLLGEPAGRFRTVSAHAVVVPRRAACSNPACPYIHRMAALVPGIEPLRLEGDLFLISDEAAGVIDELETGSAGLAGPCVRELVARLARRSDLHGSRLPRSRTRAMACARRAPAGGRAHGIPPPPGGRRHAQSVLRPHSRPPPAARRCRPARSFAHHFSRVTEAKAAAPPLRSAPSPPCNPQARKRHDQGPISRQRAAPLRGLLARDVRQPSRQPVRPEGAWRPLAESAADEAARLARETGQPRWASAAELVQATVAAERGDFERADALANRAEAELLPVGAQAMLALVQFARGRGAVAHQRYAEGLDHLKRVLDPGDVAYHPFVGSWGLSDLVEAAAHVGERDQAEAYLEQLEALSTATAGPFLLAMHAYGEAAPRAR